MLTSSAHGFRAERTDRAQPGPSCGSSLTRLAAVTDSTASLHALDALVSHYLEASVAPSTRAK